MRAIITQLFLPSIILLAALLQFSLIGGKRFHPDEALYATWARTIATGEDMWLAQHIVDKPPLFIYTLAIPFSTIGASEELARLPNVLASLCSIALLYGIACALYDERRIAWLAACVFALSPYTLLFAPTAFTDPFMLCWALMAWWLTLKRQTFYAGLAYGLALATKQDAILLLPLLVIGNWGLVIGNWRLDIRHGKSRITNYQLLISFLLGCALPLVLVVGWSLMRPQPNYWQAGLDHYGGVTWATLESYPRRIGELFTLTRALSSEWLLLLAIVVAPFLIARRRNYADIGLWLFVCYWLVVHLVLSLQLWDRYMLPLTPIAALLIARSVFFCWDSCDARHRHRFETDAPCTSNPLHGLRPHSSMGVRVVFSMLSILLLLIPVRAVLSHEINLSGMRDLYDGINDVGLFFWRTDTTATILYMHELSWEIDYYTFGRALDRRWIDSPIGLAADAGHMVLAKKFLALATWENWGDELTDALASVNLKAEPTFITYRRNGQPSIIVYHLTPKIVGTPTAWLDNDLIE